MTRAPRPDKSLKSVKGCKKCALSSAWMRAVSVEVVMLVSMSYSWREWARWSNVQQQVLALPRRNDFHELVKFEFLDLGIDRDELLAQHLVQVRLATQPVKRLTQAARQGVGRQVGITLHFGLGLDL